MMARRLFGFLFFYLFSVDDLAFARQDYVPVATLNDSVFTEVWRAIIEEAGIQAQYHTFSNDQARSAFVEGKVGLDCCSIPEWRTRGDEQQVQFYTDPIFSESNHMIIRDGDRYDVPVVGELSGYRVAVVKGFSYEKEELFGETVAVETIEDAFDFVVSGKADITFALRLEFVRNQRRNPRPLALGPVWSRTLLRARVHRDWVRLLPQVNEAIQKLKQSGTINYLVGKHIRDKVG